MNSEFPYFVCVFGIGTQTDLIVICGYFEMNME